MKKNIQLIAAFVVLIAGILISTWVQYKHNYSHLKLKSKGIALVVENKAASIQQKLTSDFSTLELIRFLFEKETNITRQEFQRFTNPIFRKNSSIKAISWVPKVTDPERNRFEAKIGQEQLKTPFSIIQLDADGKLVPALKCPFYFPVVYIEPFHENSIALGYDIYSDETRRAAIDKAIHEGRLQVTSNIKLVQDTSGNSMLGVIPVYYSDSSLPGRAGVEKVKGMISGVFKIDQLINNALDLSNDKEMELFIVDVTGNSKDTIYGIVNPVLKNSKILKRIINVGGREWELNFVADDNLFSVVNPYKLILIGSFLSVLLFFLIIFPILREERNHILIRKLRDEKIFREKTEKSLTESNDYNRALFTQTTIGLLLTSMDGKFVDANPGLAKIIGRTMHETLQLTYWELTPEKYNEQEQRQLELLKTVGRYGPYEKEYIHKDGHLVPVRLQGSIVERNGVKYIWSSVEDITERVKAEARVKALSNIVTNSLNEIYFFDAETLTFSFVNNNALRNLGFSTEEIMNLTPLDIKPEYTSETFLKALQPLLNGEKDSLSFETIHKRKDHTIYPVEVYLHLSEFDGRKVFVAMVIDITERKQVEKTSLENEIKFRNIFEHSTVGKSITAIDGRLNTNEAYREMLGYSNEELASATWQNITYPGDVERDQRYIDMILAGEKSSVRWEKRYLHKDGHIVWADISTTLQRDTAGNPLYFITTIVDITGRKRTDEMLKENAARIQSIFRSAPMGIGMVRDRILLEVNDRVSEITGYPMDELIGQSSRIFYPDEVEFESVGKNKYDQIKKQGTSTIETKFLRKDGKLIDIILNSTPLDQDDLSKGVTFTVMDISERKQAEELLKASELKFRTLADHTIDWEYWEDEHARIMYMSPSCLEMTGYTQDEFIADPQLKDKIVHPADLTKVLSHQAEINKFQQRNRIEELEFRIIKKDRSMVYLHHTCRPVFDEENKYLGRRVGNRNITRRKEYEKEVLKLYYAIEQSPVSIVITDMDGNIEYGNTKVAEITGYSLSELIGQNPRIFKSGQTSAIEYKNLWATISSGSTWYGEFQNRKKNGELYWEYASISPIKNESGETTHYLAVKEDITQRKEMMQELVKSKEHAEESDRLKSAFLANMSHEIRTPMNGILGFAELLRMPGLSGDQQQEYLGVIKNSGDRMLNIINDIMDISKIESGLVEVVLKESNINEQTEFVYTFFRPQAEMKKINLSYKNGLPANEALINTDKEKVFAILTNLVKNAIKYTDEGTIEFGYKLVVPQHAAALLEFYVNDTGIGIPVDRQQAIFDRFVQADIGDSRAFQGAGLGLAISKAYVEILGGKLWVDSQEGKGSTFYFTLPYHPVQKAKPETPATTSQPEDTGEFNRLNILIVEDDETSEMLIKIALKGITDKMYSVNSGVEAIKACRRHPGFDLVLMDIKMPGMDGYEATRQIREFNKDVVIIAQTAYGLGGDEEKALAAGCTDYLSKPLNIAALKGMIKKYFIKQ